jgi:DNA recombination protein RmuC
MYMNIIQVSILLVATVGNIVLLGMLLSRTASNRKFATDVREDLRLGREELRASNREAHATVTDGIRTFTEIGGRLDTRVKDLQEGIEAKLEATRGVLDRIRDTVDAKLETARKEMAAGLNKHSDTLVSSLDRTGTSQVECLEAMTKQVKEVTDTNQTGLEQIRMTFDTRIENLRQNLATRVNELQEKTEAKLEATREVLDKIRDTVDTKLDTVRAELGTGLKTHSDSLVTSLVRTETSQLERLDTMAKHVKEAAEANQGVLERIRSTFDNKVDELRQSLDARVKEMQEGNERKLEEMRQTVDEKLQGTLEKRLGESFKFVSDRLEMVHKGLGEMQGLAAGVGDLKRIFTNVKVRGTYAEVQLAGILEQMLTPDQWAKNVSVKEGSLERVECAIRLPGAKDDIEGCMWLPIDSKFPTEDYGRLQNAADAGDSVAVQTATDGLLRAIKAAAKDIHDKYVNPPSTTDYAIMFLATEGLYAEALREPQFAEELQKTYRVVIAGPTTLSAIVSSLRMGFQTMVVEKRAAEVWRVLGAVKTEFGKFGGVLDRVQKQLHTVTRTIEETGTRTRVMERKLRAVEQMDLAESSTILALPVAAAEEESGETSEMPDGELTGAA